VALDFGTGSGCLAIALAAKCPTAIVHAVDLSAEALATARENTVANQVADRVVLHHGDGFAALPPGLGFDLIVSNPPYIPGAEIATLEPEVRDHDPRLALDGGADGLDFYRRLAAEAAARLRPNACLMIEFGDGQAPAITEIFVRHNWVVAATEADYSGRQRLMTLRPPVA
jgi:release factor glutamine methyltransferase